MGYDSNALSSFLEFGVSLPVISRSILFAEGFAFAGSGFKLLGAGLALAIGAVLYPVEKIV